MGKLTSSSQNGENSPKKALLTPKQLEIAAKHLCALRGINPNQKAWELVAKELEDQLQVLMALDKVFE